MRRRKQWKARVKRQKAEAKTAGSGRTVKKPAPAKKVAPPAAPSEPQA
jgi:hypothetical protein